MLEIILVLIVLVNGMFAVQLLKDLLKHKGSILKEAGSNIGIAISTFVFFLLSTFGISDFALSSSLYPKVKWVSEKLLPGTLNTQCVIPVAVMALCYIRSIEVGMVTLLVAIICQVVGAYVSPRFIVKLPERVVKIFVTIGLFIAATLILASKTGLYPSGGEATALEGGKLVLFAVLCFTYGALNNIGIGSYPLTMATVYALGMNPAVAFPIMMGACTFSVPIGSMQFLKLESYSKKITAFAAVFGSLGVLAAVFIVGSLDTSMLTWVAFTVILYSAINMTVGLLKTK